MISSFYVQMNGSLGSGAASNSSNPSTPATAAQDPHHQQQQQQHQDGVPHARLGPPPPPPDSDLQDLSLEIERERQEYLEKSQNLREQLRTLKTEIEDLKVDGQASVLDRLHREQAEQGETKYSTIQKVKRGSTQSRVAFFEEL